MSYGRGPVASRAPLVSRRVALSYVLRPRVSGNQGRTNLLLELMTAELSGKASARNYQKRIAAEIGTLKLVPVPRHLIYASTRLR